MSKTVLGGWKTDWNVKIRVAVCCNIAGMA